MEEKDNLEKSVAGSIKISNITSASSSIGLIAGLGYAFSKDKGFWAYVGYGLLGSIVIGMVGNLGAKIVIS